VAAVPLTNKRTRWLPGVDMAARAKRLRQYAKQRRQRDGRQLEFPLDPPAGAGGAGRKKAA